jgi:hypothetical protein
MPDIPAALARGLERQSVGKVLTEFDPFLELDQAPEASGNGDYRTRGGRPVVN